MIREDYELAIVQQPILGRVFVGKEKGINTTIIMNVADAISERKPLDPPPIVKLVVNRRVDKKQEFLSCRYILTRTH